MHVVFWASALLIGYVYVGYPALLVVWARVRRTMNRRARQRSRPADVDYSDGPAPKLPRISIVIAARNEAARLAGRLENLLALHYPADLRQIIVVSDGSTDRTRDVVSQFAGAVQLLEVPALGKAAALNAGVARATGDVIVFADARQRFADDALLALTAPFADPAVGAVSGELILGAEGSAGRRSGIDRRQVAHVPLNSGGIVRLKPDTTPPVVGLKPDTTGEVGSSDPMTTWPALKTGRYVAFDVGVDRRTADRRAGSTVAEGVGLYWRYEKLLRRLESEVGSMLGATGAIYALRRSLWQPLPAGTILDDVLAPMRAVLAGRRVVFEPRARAFDSTARDAGAESRRKVRTLAGNVQVLWFEPRLLVPLLNPVWLQYVSHKVGRLVVPYALMSLFAASIALAESSVLYAAALFAQCAFYLHGGYGAWLEHLDSTVRVKPQSAGGRPKPDCTDESTHVRLKPDSTDGRLHSESTRVRLKPGATHVGVRFGALMQRSSRMAFTVAVMNVSAVAGVGAALLGRRVWR